MRRKRRRLRALSHTELQHLSEARLLALRKHALAIWNTPEEGDFYGNEVDRLDAAYIWFKSDPRWQPAYDVILEALARVQSRS
jgi:hypothetical protein